MAFGFDVPDETVSGEVGGADATRGALEEVASSQQALWIMLEDET